MKNALVIILLFAADLCFSQDRDSLFQTLNEYQSAGDKAVKALKTSDSLRRINPYTAYQYALLSKELEHGNDSLTGRANIAISNYYISRAKYDSAIYFLDLAQQIFTYRTDSSSLSKVLIQKGVVNYYKTNHEKAIENLLKASKILESINDTIMLASVYNNLGSFHQSRDNEYEKAVEFYTKAYYQKLRNGETLSANRSLSNIGSALTAIGKVDSGITILKKTLIIKEKVNDLTGMAITNSNIGTGFIEVEQYDSAIKYLNRALELDIRLADTTGLRYEYLWLAKAHFGSGQFDEAQKNISKGLLISNDFIVAPQLYQLQSKVYEKRKNYKNALDAFKAYKALADSLYADEKEETIQELQTKYETEKKEQEISFLSKENQLAEIKLGKRRQFQLLLTIILIITITAFILIFYIQRQKSKLKEAALQSEINQLRSEIQSQSIIQNQSFDKPLEDLNKELHNPLSDREYDILQSIFTDKTNREIADQLFISVNTVKFHLKNIYVKLGVSDRREALLKLN